MRPAVFSLMLFFLVLIGGSAFRTVEEKQKADAHVEQLDGLYIFYKAAPVLEYEKLGSVKPGLTATNKAGDMLDGLVKRAKKQFLTAEALLITDDDMSEAEVIRFK